MASWSPFAALLSDGSIEAILMKLTRRLCATGIQPIVITRCRTISPDDCVKEFFFRRSGL